MNTQLNANPILTHFGKTAQQLTKADIIDFIVSENIRQITFMYPAGDGRLKSLNFIINSIAYLDEILTNGERVDGSSLFPFIQADSSDLYVIPRFSTAFMDPFAEEPTLNLLCSFFDKNGDPLASAPEQTLRKACAEFTAVSGLEFEAMGELEYYVISEDTAEFPAVDQKGYHESGPYAKFNEFRKECMRAVTATGGMIKYGHSEVGNFTQDGKVYEQNEIEFLPTNALEAANQLVLAKWVIRNMAWKYGYDVTFAPKITVGKAGSGLHVHMRLMKDGVCVMLDEKNELSEYARRAIAGMMILAPSITAFGNTNPTSYFRLVPHQEAPTNVCWGDRNRSVLVRVPLGWTIRKNISAILNPLEDSTPPAPSQKQTVEMRSPDASADLYLLIASLAVASRLGFEMEDALDIAAKTYVNVNIHKEEHAALQASLAKLPDSCSASADCLAEQRKFYEARGVFSPAMIDAQIRLLKSHNDLGLREKLMKDPDGLSALVEKFFHCG